MKLPLNSFSNLREALIQRASQYPDLKVFTEIKSNLQQNRSCTFQQLLEKTKQIAANIAVKNPQDCRIVLLLNNDLHFIESFWACVFKGVIAVPLYPPQGNKQFERIANVIEDCNASLILTTTNIKKDLLDPLIVQGSLPDLPSICVDALPETTSSIEALSPLAKKSIALLQYTSGSSGKPKGVILTHGNVLKNAEMLIEGYNYDSEDKPLAWMPFYHDLGLMGGVLAPVLSGACTYITDARIIVRPVRLLQAISHYGITTTAAPNFVINRIVQLTKEEDLQGLNLNTLKLVISGAEPISANSLRQLTQRLNPCGFKSRSLAPSYGLAESTVLATTAVNSEFKSEWIKDQGLNREVVACGRPVLDEKIIIIEPETLSTLGNRSTGEICISGKHITEGYWNKPQENSKLFFEYDNNTYLRTGDLGFFDNEGFLYIVGRLKDLMIIRGKKYHPVDIEHAVLDTINNHPLFQSREVSVCAFQILDSNEQSNLVVLISGLTFDETKTDDIYLQNKIIEKIRDEFEISEIYLRFAEPSDIKKTSSGKIRRQETQKHFLENHF